MNVPSEKLRELYQPKQTQVVETKRQMHIARFSPCGKYLLAGGYDGLVHRWNVLEEKTTEHPSVNGHHGWVCALAFHPQNKQHVFTADSWGQLRCWAYGDQNPKPIWRADNAHDGWIHDLAVSRDGKLAATCGIDRKVRIWSTADGKLLHEFSHDEDFFSVAIHPDGKSLVAGDLKGAVKQWDLGSFKHVRDFDASVLHQLYRLQDAGGVWRLLFDEKGETLAAAGTKPSRGGTVQGIPTVLLFDWKSGKQRHVLELGQQTDAFVHDLIFHPADFIMAVTSGTPGKGKIVFWRPGEKKAFFETNKLPNCHSIAMHPDGKRLAVASTSRGSNGNGRRLNKDGEYAGNSSPIHFFQFGGSK